MSPGDLVGEYRIEEPLGRGGFGEVFSAVHPVIGKHVAIKVLRSEVASDREAVTRFTAEAAAVNRIDHPSIVDVFSFGVTADGRHYYVMELLRGESLDKRLANGRLDLSDALPILRGIAAALDAAHDAGFVHRDLKPENVFLVGDHVKLIDFGLAKLLSEQSADGPSRAGQIFGTPAYMAPEQCRGRQVTRATDIYAVGVIAFQMLTGTLPFAADDSIDALLKHVHDDPPRPSSITAVPPHIDTAILAMLAKNPEERPETASAAIALLDHPARVRRSRWPVIAAVIAVLVLVSWVLVAPTTSHEPRRAIVPTSLQETTERPDSPPAVADAQQNVVVRIESNVTAEVWRDGAPAGTTPLEVIATRGEQVEVELRAPHHVRKTHRIDAARDHTVMIELTPAPQRRPPGPDDIEVRSDR